MREFTDAEGATWTAFVVEESGTDYKGRFFLAFRPAESEESPRFGLRDVRWNSERTARRTIETMSTIEIRRRLRSALGRAELPLAG